MVHASSPPVSSDCCATQEPLVGLAIMHRFSSACIFVCGAGERMHACGFMDVHVYVFISLLAPEH